MAKTEKELAFLRDLCVHGEWTRRFTDIVDKHFSVAKREKVLYINAGTGDHAFALRDKMDREAIVFATCENEEILRIARDKALAVKSDVDFSIISFEDDSFDTVLTDASFVRSSELQELVVESGRIAKSGGKIAIFFPAAGSFGEIFSLLWEVLFNEDLGEHGAAAEKAVRDLPTVSRAEEIAEAAGLIDVETHTSNEIFEFENGAAFVCSPLVADFLLPAWLGSLDEKEKERVMEELTRLIDLEDGTLAFRFSVKATLLSGVAVKRKKEKGKSKKEE